MSYQVQSLHNNHAAGAMFPESCTFHPVSPAEITAMLARGIIAMDQATEGTWVRTSKQWKLHVYMENISRSPHITPEFFNVVDGQGCWRVPALGMNGGAEAMVCVIMNLQPRWGIVGRGLGRHEADLILRGPVTEVELYDIVNGRFPPTLAELGKPAPGVCGRPGQWMMDSRPEPRLPRAPSIQTPVYDTGPPRALTLNRPPPPRQSRTMTLRSPPPPQATRPRRPARLMRSPSPSSSSSSSSSDSSSDDSSEEEKKKPKKATKKNKEVVDQQSKGKAKVPVKRRPAAPREEEDDEEAAYSAAEKRSKQRPKPSRVRRDEAVTEPQPRTVRAGPSKQAPAPPPGRPHPRRIERSDDEEEDTAPPRRPARRIAADPPPKAQGRPRGRPDGEEGEEEDAAPRNLPPSRTRGRPRVRSGDEEGGDGEGGEGPTPHLPRRPPVTEAPEAPPAAPTGLRRRRVGRSDDENPPTHPTERLPPTPKAKRPPRGRIDEGEDTAPPLPSQHADKAKVPGRRRVGRSDDEGEEAGGEEVLERLKAMNGYGKM
ncbi:MAG: hypothetical protein L6R37_005771 [Teloschistes peruensis]|nr:MAG: hypothetical protein L6R37_005771 [Teloschistes peruensis]